MKNKRSPSPGDTHDILSAHVREYLARRYRKRGNESLTAQTKEFARDVGVSFSTMQRVVDRKYGGVALATLEKIAREMRREPYELLMPIDGEQGN